MRVGMSPAFPLAPRTDGARANEGMSLRDWYGGMALSGYLHGQPIENISPRNLELLWATVDQMLVERERPPR